MYIISSVVLFIIIYQSESKNPSPKFVSVAEGDGFIQPCSENESSIANAMDKAIFDLHHVDSEDMETILTSGKVTILSEIPEDAQIELTVDIYRWKRGEWQNSVFSLRRLDFCKTAFSKFEPWYPLAKQLPEEERVCPPKAGSVYHFNNVSNRIEIPKIKGIPDISGKYKLVVHFIYGDKAYCLSCIANTWKL